jgi:alpha-amylase
MQRRPEAYHTRLREAASPSVSAVTSIHEQTKVKEPGLERFLRYDLWPRHAFRILIFDPKRTLADYESLQLHEDAGFAGEAYTVLRTSTHDAEFVREADLAAGAGSGPRLSLTKRFSFGPAVTGCEVACELGLKLKAPLDRPVIIGLESIINLLAPAEPDRFFDLPGDRRNLRFSGEVAGPLLRMEDGWQRIRIALHAPGIDKFWIAPIETVSESEEGFERVYQGSQILARWRVSTEKIWSARLVWRIETF